MFEHRAAEQHHVPKGGERGLALWRPAAASRMHPLILGEAGGWTDTTGFTQRSQQRQKDGCNRLRRGDLLAPDRGQDISRDVAREPGAALDLHARRAAAGINATTLPSL